jgi:hypothetical protein
MTFDCVELVAFAAAAVALVVALLAALAATAVALLVALLVARAEVAALAVVAGALDDRLAVQRDHPGQRFEAGAESGDLGEDALRAADHPSGSDVVGRLMPRAHQASVGVDAAPGQVSAEVAAAPTHREVLAAIADGVLPAANDGSGRDIRGAGDSEHVDSSVLAAGHDRDSADVSTPQCARSRS